MQLDNSSAQSTWHPKAPGQRDAAAPDDDGLLLRRSKAFVKGAQSFLYSRFLDVHTFGGEHVPQTGGFIVAANHASHLDSGLVKAALGARGADLWALAAQDYFFANPWRRWYFENFTRVMPIPRGGNFKGALKRAVATVRGGDPLLIFPEGTRSVDGTIGSFKPAISSMAIIAQCPIVPMYLWGTHEAMPKGSLLLPVARRMGAVIGPAIPAQALQDVTEGLAKNQATRVATQSVELAVRSLQQGHPLTLEALLRSARRLADGERAAGSQTLERAPGDATGAAAQGRGRSVRGIA